MHVLHRYIKPLSLALKNIKTLSLADEAAFLFLASEEEIGAYIIINKNIYVYLYMHAYVCRVCV